MPQYKIISLQTQEEYTISANSKKEAWNTFITPYKLIKYFRKHGIDLYWDSENKKLSALSFSLNKTIDVIANLDCSVIFHHLKLLHHQQHRLMISETILDIDSEMIENSKTIDTFKKAYIITKVK